jgi:hypothetical protein
VAGNLEVISVAGGMLCLPQPLDPNTRASLMFLSDGGPVLGKAEMLSPLSRTQQAFRFVALDRNYPRNLQLGIQSHLSQSSDEDRWIAKYRSAIIHRAPSQMRNPEDRLWISCIRNTGFNQRGILFSFRVTQMTASHTNTRRWQRYPQELRVCILPCSRLPAIAVTGRGSGLSQGGMALHAGVDMELDDLVEIEFLTPHPLKSYGNRS